MWQVVKDGKVYASGPDCTRPDTRQARSMKAAGYILKTKKDTAPAATGAASGTCAIENCNYYSTIPGKSQEERC